VCVIFIAYNIFYLVVVIASVKKLMIVTLLFLTRD